MGIKSLKALITKYSNNGTSKIHLSKLNNKTLAVDANVYIYKHLYGNKNHIDGIFFMINKLKKFNINPIFVFDGKPPDEKRAKIIERKLIKNKLEKRLNDLRLNISENVDNTQIYSEIDKIEKKILYVDKTIIDKTIQLLDLMGVAYIQADCEAEHYCSKLSRLSLVDGVISEDTDTLACGSKLVIREFSNKSDYVVCYNTDEILYDMDINYTSFLDMCILLGTDYNPRLKGYTIDQIYELIKKYGSIYTLINSSIISNIAYDYKVIQSIINLEHIKPDILKLLSQLKKQHKQLELISFLKKFSSIDEETFVHRIKLIYKSKENKLNNKSYVPPC
tara:strand:+ start:224 stop:1228 length:1005 start_codon:yes stop_codon:yes gene_type:complete